MPAAETYPAQRVIIGIPARYHSSRFPGKPLALLAGKPVIEHVYRRAAAVPGVEGVVVATDDARILAAVEAFGGDARLTRGTHRSGTERLAEVFAERECELVVNLQGDEPLLAAEAIVQALEPFSWDASLQVSTLKTRLREREWVENPHVVKVVTDAEGYAVTFTRRPLPPLDPGAAFDPERMAYYKHIGLYVYTRDFLLRLAGLAPTPGELREGLEQLRILDHGVPIRVVETPCDSVGIDTPEDLARAEALLAGV